jgi:hypothetical protein
MTAVDRCAGYFVHPPWFNWVKLYNFHTYKNEEMPRRSFPTDLGFIPYRNEFWDRGFVKNCPIIETAERNYFSPLFSR